MTSGDYKYRWSVTHADPASKTSVAHYPYDIIIALLDQGTLCVLHVHYMVVSPSGYHADTRWNTPPHRPTICNSTLPMCEPL